MKQIVLLLLLLFLVACGGNGSLSETPTAELAETTVPAPVDTPTPEPTDTPTPEPTDTPTPEPTDTPTPEPEEGPDIVQLLEEAGNFTYLLTAFEATGLIDLLIEQQITLFAPDDAAFEKLPQEVLNALLADPDLLSATLTNHVIPEPLPAEVLLEIRNVETIDGETVTVVAGTLGAKVNNATLITPDVEASNGLIQVIDVVLLSVAPPPAAEPDDLQAGIESWIPYEPGQPLPIADAELVPGAPVMRGGVARLEGLLAESGTVINTARTIRLEENGEITYFAPIGPVDDEQRELLGQAAFLPQDEDSLVLGVVLLDGEIRGEYEAGPYLVYIVGVSSGEPTVVLYDANFEAVAEIPSLPLEEMDTGAAPGAALFFGTTYCTWWGKNWFTDEPYHVCWPCWFGQFETLAECRENL